ncbi:response regulator [bacterium]|nr:response regulator [bacterium]
MKCANLLSSSVETALNHVRAAVLDIEKLQALSPEEARLRESFLSQARILLGLELKARRFGGQRVLMGLGAGPLREELNDWLEGWGLQPEFCDDCASLYRQALQSNRLGLVIVDATLTGYQGKGSLQSVRQAGGAPVVVMAESRPPEAEEWFGSPPQAGQLLSLLERLLAPQPKASSRLNGQLGREHPLKVLIAEDLALNQKLIGLLLSRLGYQADTANNGYEVMLRVEKDDYDLILMDLNMPGMNGLEAAARVRQLKPLATGGPRLVAMSANLPNGTPQGSGFEEFLAKPVQFEQLQNVLRNSPSRKQKAHRPDSTPVLPVIDPDILSNLHRLGDREFLDSLIEDAAQELPQMVGLLMDCWERGQVGEVVQLAHAIKGSASTLGAIRVARLAGEIEQCGKSLQLQGQPVTALAAALEEALEQLQAA